MMSDERIIYDIMVEMVRHEYPVMHVARLGIASTTIANQLNIGYSKSQDKYIAGYDVQNYPYTIYPCWEFDTPKALLEVILEDNLYDKLLNNIILIELQRLDEARKERRMRHEKVKRFIKSSVHRNRSTVDGDSSNERIAQ